MNKIAQDVLRKTFGDMVKRGIFKAVIRYLGRHPDPEDRLQDAICQVWAMYQRYGLEKEKVLEAAVLVHACRLRAIDLGRHFVGSGGACRSHDVLALVAHRRGHVEVLTLDAALEAGLAKEAAPNPARKIISAIDLETWLECLEAKDRRMLAGRMAGETLATIAGEVGSSTIGVFRRTRTLGHELAERAGLHVVGEE